jgi:hypothetical protein
MAQEMLKNEALLNLVYCIANADKPIYDSEVWSNKVSNEEIEYFDKITKAENIEITFSDFIDKRIELINKYGYDSIFEEALKATNKCGREWRVKAYGYMWRMALKTWEDGDYFDNGKQDKTSDNEYSLIKKAKEYFEITDEEDDKAIHLTKV